MDKEYCEKLKQALLHLLHHGSYRLDDTCLQKLLDSIRIICKDGDQTHLDLFRPFLNDVSLSPSDDRVDVKVKTFAVHLIGILLKDEKAFEYLETDGLITRFCSKLQDNMLSQDLSVLSAVFLFFKDVIHQDPGLMWFLHSANDIIDIALTVMKSGKSLFVISSAQKFLAEFLSRTKKLASVTEDPNAIVCDNVLQDIRGRLWKLIDMSCGGSGGDAVHGSERDLAPENGCLAALEIIRQFHNEFQMEGVTCRLDRKKIDVLLSERCLKPSCVTVVLDIIDLWYSTKDGISTEEMEKIIVATVQGLQSNKQIEMALTLAQRFFHRFSADNRAVLEEVAFFPIQNTLCNPSSSHVESMKTAMENKQVFTQTLSSAITSVSKLTDQAFVDGIRNIVKILLATTQKGAAITEVRTKYLQQNAVIQRVILETIKNCIADGRQPNRRFDVDLVTDICRSLLSLIEECRSVKILMMLFNTWMLVLSLYSQLEDDLQEAKCIKGHNPINHSKGDNSDIHSFDDNDAGKMDSILDSLSFCVEKKMCDLQWEVRDSSVEFITGLISTPDNKYVEKWVKCHRLHISLWQCVRDQDSYVRATALKGTCSIVKSHCLWHSLQEHINIVDLIKKVVEIVERDSEAFPRRAAVDLLTTLYHNVPCDNQDVILRTLRHAATEDFDWDVQLNALEFWKDFVQTNFNNMEAIPRTLPEYAEGLCDTAPGEKRKSEQDCGMFVLEKLNQSGVLNVLLKTLHDSEQTVCEKACRILVWMKSKLSGLISDQNRDCGKKLKCDNPSQSKNPAHCKVNVNPNGEDSVGITVKDFISSLNELDLDNKLATICQSSDEYVRNPVSLLDDILNSLSDEQHEDNVIDCY